MSRFHVLSAFILLSLLLCIPCASSREIIVDDADASIVYTADASIVYTGEGTLSSSWTTSIQPEALDPTQIYAGTAHTARGATKATFEFTGVGIVAYFVLSNITNQFLPPTFSIDGVVQPDQTNQAFLDGNGAQIVYRAPVFSKQDLSNGAHLLEIDGNAGSDFGDSSYFILDYIEYTQQDGSSGGIQPWMIGVAVAASLVFVVAVSVVAFCIRQRRNWARGIYEPVTLENGEESSNLLYSKN